MPRQFQVVVSIHSKNNLPTERKSGTFSGVTESGWKETSVFIFQMKSPKYVTSETIMRFEIKKKQRKTYCM